MEIQAVRLSLSLLITPNNQFICSRQRRDLPPDSYFARHFFNYESILFDNKSLALVLNKKKSLCHLPCNQIFFGIKESLWDNDAMATEFILGDHGARWNEHNGNSGYSIIYHMAKSLQCASPLSASSPMKDFFFWVEVCSSRVACKSCRRRFDRTTRPEFVHPSEQDAPTQIKFLALENNFPRCVTSTVPLNLDVEIIHHSLYQIAKRVFGNLI